MNIIGFSFTKISGQLFPNFKEPSYSMSTNIEFLEVEKEEIAALQGKEAIKINFSYSVNFSPKDKDAKGKEQPKLGAVSFEGIILLSSEKEETKEMLKFWKKREVPIQFKVPIFNLILKKCTARALQLEDELGLPAHIPIPTLSMDNKPEEQKK